MSESYHIHYVCSGNTYRSRLAEAFTGYLSRDYPNITVSSSGIRAQQDHDGPITWLAMRLIKHHELLPYMSYSWQQTSPTLLADAQLVVFMENEHLEACQRLFKFEPDKSTYKVLKVEDTRYHAIYQASESIASADNEAIKQSDSKFKEIKEKIISQVVPLTGIEPVSLAPEASALSN